MHQTIHTLSGAILAPRSAPAHALPALAPGHARTLRPRRAGELRVTRGCVWVTQGGGGRGDMPTDVFLQAGEWRVLRAGERVVLEPVGVRGARACAALLEWREGGRWRAALAGPAAELRLALRHTAQAVCALARGLAACLHPSGGRAAGGRLGR